MQFLNRSGIGMMACALIASIGCGDPMEPADPTPDTGPPTEDPRRFGSPPGSADDERGPDVGAGMGEDQTAAGTPERIEVDLEPKSGSELSGTATFEQRDDGVHVSLEVSDLPAGTYAVHIHQTADCSAPDASTAGEHFNPENEAHGIPPAEERHLGDLGNLEVNEEGGTLEITVPGATLDPNDPKSFTNRAIVVHEKEDTGAQPSGAAGGRIGCGEIQSGL